MIVTPYERSHRQHVLDLMFHNQLVFTHLDWHDVTQWLDTRSGEIIVSRQDTKINGILASSAPLNGSVWLRLAAVDGRTQPKDVLWALWYTLCDRLRAQGVNTVSVLVLESWLLDFIPAMGFAYDDEIITLSRTESSLAEQPPSVTIRPSNLEDLKHIIEIDQQAFSPPWQMSELELRQARSISTYCTVAVDKDQITGYEISTLYQQNGHLARLAVLPEMQHHGVGSALLHDLLRKFLYRNINTVTVNTQARNYSSQRLYHRYGFQRNGYDLPVWTANINKAGSHNDRNLF